MNAMQAIKQIKVMLGMEDTVVVDSNEIVETSPAETETVVELASATLADGTKVEAESFEIGNQLLVITEEGPISAPEGVHETTDGVLLTVDASGTITSVDSKETEEAEAEEKPVDEFSSEDFLNQIGDLINSKFDELANRINAVNEEFHAYKNEPAAPKITNNLNEVQKSEQDMAAARFEKIMEFRKQTKQ